MIIVTMARSVVSCVVSLSLFVGILVSITLSQISVAVDL